VATFIWWSVADAQQRGKNPWLVPFLVVAVPVLGWLLWLALRPPIRNQPTSRLFLPDRSWIADWALFLGVALSWYTVGTTWVAQMVIYPLRMYVGTENASAHSTSYVNRIALPIILPFTLAMLLSVFIWFRTEGVPFWTTWVNAWINAAMIVLARVYIRLQLKAEGGGYSESANARLLRIHWTRVAAFTADGLVLLWMLAEARRAASGRMHSDAGR
jgi:hypothetical protein